MRKSQPRYCILAAALIVFSACSGNETQALLDSALANKQADSTSLSYVRFINAVPGANGLSVSEVSANELSIFVGVDYKAVTQYQDVSRIITSLRLFNTERDTTINVLTPVHADGARRTMVASQSDSASMAIRFLPDDHIGDSLAAHVRVVHTVRGLGKADFVLAGTDTVRFESVAISTNATYARALPGNTTLRVSSSSGNRALLQHKFKLEAGHAYTVVLTVGVTSDVDVMILDDRSPR